MARRNTIQRSLVLEAVNRLHCHATADEVYEEIIKEHPTISKATVYRNLNLLSEMVVTVGAPWNLKPADFAHFR